MGCQSLLPRRLGEAACIAFRRGLQSKELMLPNPTIAKRGDTQDEQIASCNFLYGPVVLADG